MFPSPYQKSIIQRRGHSFILNSPTLKTMYSTINLSVRIKGSMASYPITHHDDETCENPYQGRLEKYAMVIPSNFVIMRVIYLTLVEMKK